MLKESQVQLESQQAELEQTNSQLEEQASMLESQRDELQRAQMALTERAAELERANQYKSEFLANMSHELRTPLNSSLILAKLLADNKPGKLNEEQVKFAQTIFGAGNDLLALINDILDLSKIEAGKVEVQPESLSIVRTVETLSRGFEPLARERQLAFTYIVEPGAPERLETDPQRLGQILKNLLSNAFKFTENGAISLRVAAGPDGQVIFAVQDSGIGIPPRTAGDHFRGLPPGRRQHPSEVRRHGIGPVDFARPGAAVGRRRHGAERGGAGQHLHAQAAAAVFRPGGHRSNDVRPARRRPRPSYCSRSHPRALPRHRCRHSTLPSIVVPAELRRHWWRMTARGSRPTRGPFSSSRTTCALPRSCATSPASWDF